MKRKTALITGITGQDGAYLAEFLLEKNYVVHGLKRRTSLFNTDRIDHLINPESNSFNENFFLHFGDMTDSSNLIRIIKDTNPDEIYNLAAMSHVKVSFELPEYVADVDGLGTLRILEAVRLLGLNNTRIYQASTSELFGKVQEIPQSERTPFYPRSPYGVAKMYAYWITVNYREAYKIFASNGILFNHESPRRGETFVTRKITRAVSKISLGLQKVLELGNLDSKRDWGHARDYVEVMWLILQYQKADDWVIATGQTTTIRDFVIKAFDYVGIKIGFKGTGLNEIGYVKSCSIKKYDIKVGETVVKVNPKYFRPTEVDILIGDSSKAEKYLGWKPKISIDQMLNEMMKNDIENLNREIK